MKIDLCVFLSGNYLEYWTPLFFETLFKKCDVSDLHIHVVEKGLFKGEENPDAQSLEWAQEHFIPIGENVHNYVLKKKEESPVPFTIYTLDSPFYYERGGEKPFFLLANDHAETVHWAIENCGESQWMIFCHTDIVFLDDVIEVLKGGIAPNLGMFGIHAHCFILNVEAYQQVGIKFNAVSCFFVEEIKAANSTYVVRHINDPECKDKSKPIFGWDTGRLLELVMVGNKWKCNMNDGTRFNLYVAHGGSGHGYGQKGSIKQEAIKRLEELTQKHGVQKI